DPSGGGPLPYHRPWLDVFRAQTSPLPCPTRRQGRPSRFDAGNEALRQRHSRSDSTIEIMNVGKFCWLLSDLVCVVTFLLSLASSGHISDAPDPVFGPAPGLFHGQPWPSFSYPYHNRRQTNLPSRRIYLTSIASIQQPFTG
ncbi:hypothetical protein CTAM01_16936, partial [Colletotrichum tamarilloi]